MGKVYRNLMPIPIPSGCHVNNSDKRVSVFFRDGSGHQHRLSVGMLASASTMYPNFNFRHRFPDIWEASYGKSAEKPHELHAGLYAAALAIGTRTGIYGVVQESCGPETANALMDFSVATIEDRSNSAELFEENIRTKLCFSRKRWSDSWMSELFNRRITGENIHRLRLAWAEKCASRGVSAVWLIIDGTNFDCDVQKSDLAEHGHSKSGKSKPVVSVITAVSAGDATPVTWFVHRGSLNDTRAFADIFNVLSKCGIRIEGVIIDRGFACQTVLDAITSRGLDYIVMLKSSSSGYGEMLRRHALNIRWNVRYCIDRNAVFGTTDRVRVFAGSREESCVALLYDAVNSSGRSVAMVQKIWDALEEVSRQLPGRVEDLTIPPKAGKYLSFELSDGVATAASFNFEAWQLATNRKGFSAIASSRERSPEEILKLYRLRDAVEKQFSVMKSQLGYNAVRVHSDEAIESKMAACFIATVIRTEIMRACRRRKRSTNKMIRILGGISLTLGNDDKYSFANTIPDKARELLAEFGVLPGHFDRLAEEANREESDELRPQERTLPSLEPPPLRKGGRPKKEKPAAAGSARRKPGRPKGSRNRKTVEKEALEAAQREQEAPVVEKPEKRRPGRPKGSRNKATLKREALAAAGNGSVKRGRGRPRGSRNRKTIEREAQEALALKAVEGTEAGSEGNSEIRRNDPDESAAVRVEDQVAVEAAPSEPVAEGNRMSSGLTKEPEHGGEEVSSSNATSTRSVQQQGDAPARKNTQGG